MNKSETDDSNVIQIEVCQNCRLHRWCTRHDEKKYNLIYENVSKAIIKELGSNFKVLKNQNISKPRIGAFEIMFKDKIIFSKISKGCFPDPAFVASKAKEIVEGKEENEQKEENEKIEKKVNEEEKKNEIDGKKLKKKIMIPKAPNDTDFRIPKYDIICPSPTKIHRAYRENEGFMLEKNEEQEKKN